MDRHCIPTYFMPCVGRIGHSRTTYSSHGRKCPVPTLFASIMISQDINDIYSDHGFSLSLMAAHFLTSTVRLVLSRGSYTLGQLQAGNEGVLTVRWDEFQMPKWCRKASGSYATLPFYSDDSVALIEFEPPWASYPEAFLDPPLPSHVDVCCR